MEKFTLEDFFGAIFDYNEATSFAKHHKGTKVYNVDDYEYASEWAIFFCINPLNPHEDLNPTEEYHAADKPRRCDKNVTAYRNILIEMDNLSIKEQAELIESIGMPYTTAVFSGGKSIHYIISLENPIEDEKQYRHLVERIHKALGGKSVVDVANKNPSRFSRFPNAIREDKGNTEQTLLKVQSRVQNEVLLAWVEGLIGPDVKPVKKNTTTSKPLNSQGKRVLNGWTLNFIMMGAEPGERNLSLFKAACDFAKCGYSREEAWDKLFEPSGLDQREAEQTIKSAFNKVRSEEE